MEKSRSNSRFVLPVIGIGIMLLLIMFTFGDYITSSIVDKVLGLPKIQRESEQKNAQLQLHLEEVRGIRAEAAALNGLAKSWRSARTENERAFLRSEEAKLRLLSAERVRLIEAAKADLQKEIAR
jgi:hypothetical protein